MATKKLKKAKKGMSQETKTNLINVFKSIISNQACVDGGKDAPFWIAIIFFVIAVILPVIPITVNYSKQYGSSFIASKTYGADRGLANTTDTLKAAGAEFTVVDNLLTWEGVTAGQDAVATDIIDFTEGGVNKQEYNFMFYVSELRGADLDSLINELINTRYEKGTLNKYDVNKQDEYTANETKFYSPSFILLTPETIQLAVFKHGTTDGAGSTYRGNDWTHTSGEKGLIARVLDIDNNLTDLKRTDAIYNNWKGILNEAFINSRDRQTLQMSLIYLGVYAALILFLGVMIFLLTRGKTNAFNYLKIYQCMFIVMWASFTPALLGMVLGFFMGSNVIGQMGFIVLVSIRVMWMSMRQLRPITA